ncbi:MAG TPA: sigma-70 family RNA polymerase sigma factor [Candidatus Binatia bacterium]|jgi:RNA polymerase sigma-70 factor (ECF subfamily)|nr:sigma-70 family RNA polymerase sigma factor [Candidatus Binatia bacterium]
MTRLPGSEAPRPADGAVPGSAAASDPDVALMLQVQQGDQSAFPELFRRFGPRILQYVRRLVKSDARAEEITQDVFVQIFRFRERYRPESKLSTWVFTIATNLALNELRRPERVLKVDIWDTRGQDERREGPSLPDPNAISPEEGAASRELARALETAIAELPPKQRAALLLSRVDGMAYRDVAEALGSTEGAIKALLFRATHSLKDRLRDFL